MNNFAMSYYRFCIRVMRFAYLNILWILFTVAGLFIFGLMPATAAMFTVVRKWVTGDKDVPIFKTFWHNYKTEFVKSNIIGYIFGLIGYLMVVEMKILLAQQSKMYLIASLVLLGLIALYFIGLLYVFPVFAHFRLTIMQYIKWPFIIGIVHPLLTVFMGIGILIIYTFTIANLPALLIFYGGSVPAQILTWGASKAFINYEATTSMEAEFS